MDLCNAETVMSILLQIMYDVIFFISVARSFFSRLQVVSRALDKTVDRNAHHGDVADTPSPPREHN